MTKRQLYLFVTIFWVTGCLWVLLQEWHLSATRIPDICLFKRVTGLPCPSCGSTHALLKLMELRPVEAFYINPFGYVLATGLSVLPLWLLYDGLRKRHSFYTFYIASESFIRRRWVSTALISVVMINWLWNIYKY